MVIPAAPRLAEARCPRAPLARDRTKRGANRDHRFVVVLPGPSCEGCSRSSQYNAPKGPRCFSFPGCINVSRNDDPECILFLGSVQVQSDCRRDRLAMHGVYPVTTIAPVPMSRWLRPRGSRGVPGPKVGKNERKTAMEPHRYPATVWIPVVPLLPVVPSPYPWVPVAPGRAGPGPRSYMNKETKELQDPREARIKKILRRGPGYRPPNPPGPTLSGPVISGEPLIPGCPGWTGWFGERYLLVPRLKIPLVRASPGPVCLGSRHQMSPSTSDCRAHASPLFIPDLFPKEPRVA